MDVARVMYMILIFIGVAYAIVAIPIISIVINEYTNLAGTSMEEFNSSFIEVNNIRYAKAEVVSTLMLSAGEAFILLGVPFLFLRVYNSYKLLHETKQQLKQIPVYMVMAIPIYSVFLYVTFTTGLGYISIAKIYDISASTELINMTVLMAKILTTLVSIDGIISIILVVKSIIHKQLRF